MNLEIDRSPALSFYTTMAHYNIWMNQKLYDACEQISDEERKLDRGAFFKSVHSTLNHLLFGDLAWMGRFIDRKLTDKKIGEDLYESFDELRSAREKTDREILDWTKNLSSEWLESSIVYASQAYGRTRILPAWLLVTHMFNHQTHHRGQLTTLLTQMGYDVGSTDLPWMPSLAYSEQ
ncbi:MAG: damage-inducible protein DinB [Cyanobacteria bacterium SID2]|nr:damage-inducible protein DinB [Cyanobacteria bacterium SID2]MBP0005695.1 damage-inducible protein DinB [Cyanobacteria bacterium SBC]